MVSPSIYLDHNATTPVLPAVVAAMCDCYVAPHLNPASQHAHGRRSRRVLEDARQRIAEFLGAGPSGTAAHRLIFTSGGTEANNLAIFGLIGGRDATPGHLLISPLEHPSVSRPAEYLARRGWKLERLPVEPNGRVQVRDFEARIRSDTGLVSVMLASNETGVLQPVAELAEICRRRQVPFHTDAAQVVGKLSVDFDALGVSSLSFAPHKFHGPLGSGGLVVRHDVPLMADMHGGTQQGAYRPGTESAALVVGVLRALEIFDSEKDVRKRRLSMLRDRLESAIRAERPDTVVLGIDSPRLPNTSNVAFVGLDRQALFMALDIAGVACSTGSACASGSSEPSPTHVAMGCPREICGSALRFSLGATTTSDEIDDAAQRILAIANQLSGHRQR